MPPEQFKPENTFVEDATVESSNLTSAPQTSVFLPTVGQVLLGQYEVIKKLGEGGMSDVFLCRHMNLEQLVAIKVLHLNRAASEISLRRFKQEAKATFKLNHPNIIRMQDYRSAEDGSQFIVMEYLDGKPLSEILLSEGTLDVESFIQIFSKVCDGLEYAHDKGVIHRDLKPSNLMVRLGSDVQNHEVKIVDFGIAKVIDMSQGQDLTKSGDIFGSPLYMSPEQCKGLTPDRRSDLYSLGCTMFECLTGVPPFRAETQIQTLFMHVEKPVPSLRLKKAGSASTVAAIEEIVTTLLSKDPSQRFQSAADVKKALQESRGGHFNSPAEGFGRQTPSSLKPYLVASIATIAAVLLILACLTFVPLLRHHLERSSGANRSIQSADGSMAKEENESPLQLPAGNKDPYPEDGLETPSYVQSKIAVEIQNLFARISSITATGKPQKAFPLFERAFRLAHGLGIHDLNRRTITVGYCAAIFISGDKQLRPKLYYLMPQAEQQLNDEPRMLSEDQANIYGWHGIIEFEAHRYAESLRLLKKAESVSANELGLMIEWLPWQGNCYACLGQMRAADSTYDRAEKMLGSNHPSLLCSLYCSRVAMYLGGGRSDLAMSTLSSARKLAESGLIAPSSNEYKHLATLLSDMKQPPLKQPPL